jgi:tRNA (cytidine32/uridine32-2'-O)-methyltransferase
VLERARVVATFDEAVADCQLVIGTSARSRTIPWPLLDSRRCCQQAYAEAGQGRVAFVFGREDRGLTNEELQRCNLHVNIPANEAYSSLNLAMAVQVIAYELRMVHLGETLPADPMAGWDLDHATAGDLERLYAHFEQALAELGFLQSEAPKQMMTRLRRLFQRARPDRVEVNILRGILSSAQQAARRKGK